jgi:3-dehydroquinate synthase
MKINYKIDKKRYVIEFCPDKEGTKIKKKKNSYTSISKDLNKDHKDQKVLLVIDKKINKSITRYLIHDLKISFPKLSILYLNGEKTNKNIKVLFKIIDKFFKNKFIKKSVLISFGGGVTGDICGLASSLYLRGLVHLHIPTTMTSIIDSCIGGKTGINYKGAINSIGTYYHPEKVYISKNVISLLPQREYIAGIPEILKCALISKNPSLNLLKNKNKILSKDFSYISRLIKYTLQTKISFFKDDVFEENKRLNLNFGHTFAHAIEMALDRKNKSDKIRHGEAVGIGLLCEIFYKNGKNKNFIFTKKILELFDLPTNISKFIKKNEIKKFKNKIYENIFLDKKRINKFPRYIKLQNLGNSTISEMKNFKRIKETLNKIVF